MRLEPPSWWYGGRTPLIAWGLLPIALIYGAVVQRRFKTAPPYRSTLPVICVGNFTAGGAGKTPVALKLAALLREAGRKPGFLTRGYGGKERGPRLVDAVSDDAAHVGDEPLLLAAMAPTVVSRDRPAGARLLESAGADVIVMDDGFQNPSLKKDFSLIVIDASAGIGSGRVFPLGPLRAPLGFQAKMADAILILKAQEEGEESCEELQRQILNARRRSSGTERTSGILCCKRPPPSVSSPRRGKDARTDLGESDQRLSFSPSGEGQDEGVFEASPSGDLDVFDARVVPAAPDGIGSQPVLAFCGIGRPAKFFATVQQAGIAAVGTRPFPDHHAFSEAEARSLICEAKALGAGLLTTEKDRVRLAGHTGARRELYLASQALPIMVQFAEGAEARLMSTILSRLQ
jgi:tetraacyldisaccharide 4'-kinase